MENVVIACEMLKTEVVKAMNMTGCNFPIIWIDSEQHNDPDKLREKLQRKIDSLDGKDNILLVFGCCGNALVGIKATASNLIIPKVDDCISMVLCKQGEKFERMKDTYFLTKGWIESSKSLMVEYERAIQRYGVKNTERIFKVMLKNYKHLMLIDTGAYNIDEYMEKARAIANITNLRLIIKKGGIWLIKKLLMGPYDDDFCLIPKSEEIKLTDFGYDSSDNIPQSNLF